MDSLERLRLEIQTLRLNRRAALKRAMGLGLSAPVIAGLLAACGGDDDDDDEPTATTEAIGDEDATATEADEDEATEEEEATEADEEEATEEEEATATDGDSGRGQGDLLRIIYVNSPNILNSHLASGGHESQAASLTLEPLLKLDEEPSLVPALAAEVPSLENGGLAADGTSVTYKLRDDVVWSDGEPFTAEDVRFTWEFITHPDANTTSIANYRVIEDVEVVDEHTVTIRFSRPNAAWFVPFSTGFIGHVLPKHLLQDYLGANAREAPFNMLPVGTGPYKVVEFLPGDTVFYEINEHYREPDKPYFRRVELLGGIEAIQAVQSVLVTGEADYTWFIQAEADVLDEMTGSDNPGELIIRDGKDVERIELNLSDPHTEVDGERSKLGVPHPFQDDLAVRQAFTYVPDRDGIVQQLWREVAEPTANTLPAPARFASPNTSYEFNLERAAQLLDEAGWTVQNGVRQKDGVEMRILYQTSQLSVRQKVQEIIKQALESLNIPVELKAIPGSVFFGSDPGQPDNLFHFFADWQEYATSPRIPYPIDYMVRYKSSEPETDIPQQSNSWSGRNTHRWVNEEFNQLYDEALTEFDPERQEEIFIRMNDLIVMEDIIDIPLFH